MKCAETLLDAGVQLDALSDEGKKAVDLCADGSPMKALLVSTNCTVGLEESQFCLVRPFCDNFEPRFSSRSTDEHGNYLGGLESSIQSLAVCHKMVC